MSGSPMIDWSRHDAISEQTLTCRCGTSYRSHVKVLYDGPFRGMHARKPCPGCSRFDGITRASTDPESMEIHGDAPGAT